MTVNFEEGWPATKEMPEAKVWPTRRSASLQRRPNLLGTGEGTKEPPHAHLMCTVTKRPCLGPGKHRSWNTAPAWRVSCPREDEQTPPGGVALMLSTAAVPPGSLWPTRTSTSRISAAASAVNGRVNVTAARGTAVGGEAACCLGSCP